MSRAAVTFSSQFVSKESVSFSYGGSRGPHHACRLPHRDQAGRAVTPQNTAGAPIPAPTITLPQFLPAIGFHV